MIQMSYMNKFTEYLARNKFLISLLLISIFTHWRWVFTFQLITHGDWVFSSKQALDTLRANYFSIWMSDNSLGRVLLDVGQAPTYFLYGVFSKYLGFGFEYSERIVHLYPVVFAAPIGVFSYLRRITKNEFASFLGSIIILFNTYFLILQTGHLTLAGAFTIIPFVFLYLDKILVTPNIKDSLILSILFALLTSYEPRLAFVIFPLLLFYSLVFFIKNENKLNLFKYLVLSFFVYVTLNVYWIVGIYSAGASTNNNIFDRSLWGSKYFTLNNSFTIYHSFWTGGKLDIFGVNSPPFYFWLLPLAFIISILFGFKQSIYIKIFSFVALIGILLTKQEAAPFIDLYKWLFDNFPGFKVFREASKFYSLIVFGYGICISIFVSIILQNKNVFLKKIVKVFSIFLIILLLHNTTPLLNESIGSTFLQRNIPEEYVVLNNFLNNQGEYFRTLSYPIQSRWIDYSYIHPRITASDLLNDHLGSLLKANYIYNEKDLPNQYDSIIKSNFSDQIFDIMSIKYVIVPTLDIENDNNSFVDHTKEDDYDPKSFNYKSFRHSYIDKLRSVPFLSEIKVGNGSISVFENKDFKSYYSTFGNLYNVTNTNISNKLNFANSTLNQKLNYSLNNNESYASTLDYLLENSKFDSNQENIVKKNIINGDLYLKNKYFLSILRNKNYVKISVVPELKKLEKILLRDNLYDEPKTVFESKIEENTKINLVLNGTEYFIDKNIYEYPIDNKSNLMEIYLNSEKISTQIEPNNINEVIKLDSSKLDFSVIKYNLTQNTKNLAIDGSFEESLWQEKVGDCNNYDSNPKLSFEKNSDLFTEGVNSIELNAARHNACISQKIDVKPGETYFFSFDYYIKNGTEAGFSFGSPDMNNTDIIYERLKGRAEWRNYSRKIKIPNDINQIYINLYGFQLDETGEKLSSTLYDNVVIKNIPNTEDFGYLVNSRPNINAEDVQITETLNNLTLKKLRIRSGEEPFFLRVSERFNKKWQLKFNDKVLNDKTHFELNETVQGWYIDTKTLCDETKCEKDKDGKYTYNIEIEFTPQRIFNIALIFSATTFVLILTYLLYSGIKTRR